jgi:Malectin domain
LESVCSPASIEQARAELAALLTSGVLARAPRQAKLLAYVCEEHFHDRSDQIKEYTLATEVLERPPGFDQSRDAIVRVEVYRLRKKLREYYQSTGAHHALHIVIQPGQYIPSFVRREESPYRRDDGEPAPDDAAVAALGPDGATVDGAAGASLSGPSAEQVLPAGSSRPEPDARWWRARSFWAAAGVAVLIVAVVLAVVARGSRRLSVVALTAGAGRAAPVPGTDLPAAGGAADEVRIRAGYFNGTYVDRAGNIWQSDRYFSGGDALAQSRQYIARTLNPGMFQTMRSGLFSYDVPLQAGNYELRLYFSETHYGPDTLSGGGETSRLFDVGMNGQPLLHIFDIIKDADGNDTADVRVFKDVHPASDGKLHLNFHPLIDAPVLNAIEIVPAPPGRINPIRIVAQENSYTDHAGNVWQPDQYSRGGQFAVHLHRTPVSGTLDPDLYVGERFGNFDYAIPVAPGRYAATLYFAETYWGTDNQRPGASLPDYSGSPEGGAGSRIFDVYANGHTLLKDFDIFQQAGGPGRALVKTFHNLEPDGEGKLTFRFVPQRDYACINAIEIVDESR